MLLARPSEVLAGEFRVVPNHREVGVPEHELDFE